MCLRASPLVLVVVLTFLLGSCTDAEDSSAPKAYKWGDVSFTYPGEFREDKAEATNGMDEALVFKGFMYKSDQASGLFFAAFDLPSEMQGMSQDEVTSALETLRANGSEVGESVTVAGLPGLRDEWHAAKALNNKSVTRRDTVIVDVAGSFVFRFTCQYRAEHEQAVKQGCEQVLSSFSPSPNE